jgi:hypothetical protein
MRFDAIIGINPKSAFGSKAFLGSTCGLMTASHPGYRDDSMGQDGKLRPDKLTRTAVGEKIAISVKKGSGFNDLCRF